MTPFQYVKQELTADRFPSMPVIEIAGSFYLCDGDWHILPGGKTYASKDAAMADRSKIIGRVKIKEVA